MCVSLTTASVCLNFQASLRESWLDDMMHVLEGEALGQDAATVEAAFKRHEAISTDVKARVSDITCKLPVFCVCLLARNPTQHTQTTRTLRGIKRKRITKLHAVQCTQSINTH